MENSNESNIQLIDGKMVDIDKLSSQEADALISKVDEKIKKVEDELKKLIFEQESEAE